MNRGGAETLIMISTETSTASASNLISLSMTWVDAIVMRKSASLAAGCSQSPATTLPTTSSIGAPCRSFFSSHHYPIVHGHIGLPAPIYLSIAREHEAKCIAHSHAQNYPLSAVNSSFALQHIQPAIVRIILWHADCRQEKTATVRTSVRSDRFHILKNGIDIERTRFEERNRAAIRKNFALIPKTCYSATLGA